MKHNLVAVSGLGLTETELPPDAFVAPSSGCPSGTMSYRDVFVPEQRRYVDFCAPYPEGVEPPSTTPLWVRDAGIVLRWVVIPVTVIGLAVYFLTRKPK